MKFNASDRSNEERGLFLAYVGCYRTKVRELIARANLSESVPYLGGSAIRAGARLVATVLVAREIGPASYGPWNILALVLSYGALTHLGILTGLRRELPFWLGRGNDERARQSLGVGWTFTIGPALIVATVIAVALPLVGVQETVAVFLSIALFTRHAKGCVFAQHEARLRFKLVGIGEAVGGIALVGTASVMAGHIGLAALPLAFAVGHTAAAIVAVPALDLRPVFKLEREIVWRLLRIGFPILAAGFVFRLISTVDRWFIGWKLSTLQLGWYTIPILVFAALTLLRSVISQQVYPRMSFAYGEGSSKGRLAELVSLQNYATQIILAALTLGGVLVLPHLVDLFIPDYAAGVKAGQIMCLGVLGLSLGTGQANLLNATGRQDIYLSIQATALLLNGILLFGALRYHPSIEAVAMADAVTFLLYGGTLTLVGNRALDNL